mmetsp:Transcript_23729/g.56718  ORF Transcript_23729/g.56718 Transcript_23729/m.56718 type:complete len:84 (+) Transcript_23729:8-259(+)
MLQALMGTTTSPYATPIGSAGTCGAAKFDFNPMSQPCASDFEKQGLWAPANSITRLEHLRPGMYSGIKGGYDSFWKTPNFGNP